MATPTFSVTLSDGTRYIGEHKNGVFHGSGHVQLPDGSSYLGDFQNGVFHGFGIFVRKDHMQYRGQFTHGKLEGKGLVTFADGTHGVPRNEGLFLKGKLIERRKCDQEIADALSSAERAKALIVM